MVRDLETQVTDFDDLDHTDLVMVVIYPDRDQPVPSHAYLNAKQGADGGYHHFFVPWTQRVENPVPEDANWRYGYQAVDTWGEDNVVVRPALQHNR